MSAVPSRPKTGRFAIIGGTTAVVLAAATAFVAPWEGRRLTPYYDIVGVLTVCDGSTFDVEQRRYTPAECDARLQTDIGRHYTGLTRCIHRPVTVNQMVAVTSWAFNVGVAAACRSTLVRWINAGEPATVWCFELLKWDKAGGRRVRGLTNRRRAELEVCLS